MADNEYCHCYFDGASESNPGRAGIGGVIISPDGDVVWEHSEGIGTATNNEAEYRALIAVAEELGKMGVKKAIIHGDSQLVVNQVNGNWRINHAHLYQLREAALVCLLPIPDWSLEWVPREGNRLADKLSKKAIENVSAPQNQKQFTGEIKKVAEHIFLAHGKETYAVDIQHSACTCPAFTNSKQKHCKHLEAVRRACSA
ncbi:MAG: ribonuclease HI family protein [Bacillota bacterium]